MFCQQDVEDIYDRYLADVSGSADSFDKDE